MEAVVRVEVIEGAAYEERHFETGEVNVRWDFFALAETPGGKFYTHPHAFRWRQDAERFVERVAARGDIDRALWVEQEASMSLEERFAIYAANEQEVRMGYRAEEDLYHGV